MGTDVASLLEHLPPDIECQNYWRSEIRLEKGIGIGLAANGEKSDVELSDETEDVKNETEP